jgi:DNA-binding NtrC family response regulator
MILPETIDAPARLLIVDEEPAVCYTLEHILCYYGYAVCSVTDGAVATARLLQEEFDLLLIERRLPGRIDGQSLIRMAAEHQPDLAIVLLTGTLDLALPCDRAEVRRYPAIDKTASAATIATCVARALAPRARQRGGPPAARAVRSSAQPALNSNSVH